MFYSIFCGTDPEMLQLSIFFAGYMLGHIINREPDDEEEEE